MNQVTLIGRLTSDLELKEGQSTSTMYTQFTLAVHRYKEERQTEFFDVVAFGKKAELLTNYTGKGRKLLVSGHLHNSFYTNVQGDKLKKTKVILEDFEFIDYKKEVTTIVEA